MPVEARERIVQVLFFRSRRKAAKTLILARIPAGFNLHDRENGFWRPLRSETGPSDGGGNQSAGATFLSAGQIGVQRLPSLRPRRKTGQFLTYDNDTDRGRASLRRNLERS
jgi:hypothetical protein